MNEVRVMEITRDILIPRRMQHEQGTKEQQRSQEKTFNDRQGKKGRKENQKSQ